MRHASSSFYVFLNDSLVSRSNAKAKYCATAHVIAECCYLQQLLQEHHISVPLVMDINCENMNSLYMMANPVQHCRTKHIEIDIHFVTKKVALRQVCVLHIPSTYQFADMTTKGFPIQLFTNFWTSVCARDPTATIAERYQDYCIAYGCTTLTCTTKMYYFYTWLYI